MAAGYDISASSSRTASAATGATSFGNKVSTQFISGGSNGISVTIILVIAGIGVALWWFFGRGKP